jgi:uncharacterized membrane protein YdjX (TVP38/TMEM64 family)
MEKEANFFSESKEKIQDYVKDRILLLRLELIEKISKLVSVMFVGLLITILSFFIVLFLSLMGGYYFAALTGSLYLGFGIVCGFYILVLIFILLAGKKLLNNFIINIIIKTVFDKTADNDDTDDDNRAA